MTVSTPERSIEQRMAALEKANAIRTQRAAWKRAVKRREVDPLAVLADPPAEFASMKVLDALLAMPKVGRVKASSMLRLAQASPSKTLAGLSERQRGALLALMRGVRR